MSKHDDLVKKLKEIFQIDRPDLDFGIYRILNTRAKQIEDYLNKRLKIKVAESLAKQSHSDTESQLATLKAELREEFGKRAFDDKGNLLDETARTSELGKRWLNLQAQAPQLAEQENAVFSHLLTFFSRYYDNGDFISQRRYKGDTYAIPYAGEEVMLHWANKDQYYTKSGENFANFAFKLSDGRTVRFKLVAADTAKDNRKDNDKERRFVLIDEHTRTQRDEDGEDFEETMLPVAEVKGELVLQFEYKPMPNGTKQDELTRQATHKVLAHPLIKTHWLELTQRDPTEKNPQRTLLEKHLSSFTTKNSADYFIHKDLGGFLRRELDFYIKNEVMNLDDVQNAEKFADIEKNLRLIQTLRSIAHDLIAFLAQLEDFQKKLWLKKKFVVATHYCVTLDRVPKALYAAIAANERQWQQWQALGMLDDDNATLFKQAESGTLDYLSQHPYLMVDTALFEAGFKYQLLAALDDLDDSLDGVLIHGDNFQALNLLQERYREQVQCVYIDPPYNTDASAIIYKNGFKNSSWAAFLHDRIGLCAKLIKYDGGICATIDDFEFPRLRYLIENCFGNENLLGIAVIKNNPSGRSTAKGFSIAHEYGIFASKSQEFIIGRLEHSEHQRSRYKLHDDTGHFEWVNFRKHGGANANRYARRKLFYPIFILKDATIRIPEIQWNHVTNEWELMEEPKNEETVIYPINSDGEEKTWKWGHETAKNALAEFSVRNDQTGEKGVYIKSRLNEDGTLPLTVWDKKEYSSTEYGTNYLKRLFGVSETFSFPKSIFAVIDSIKVCNTTSTGLTLDYFAGSGTTGHAVINLNRQDKGQRKYILVEQGEYFDTVLKPRIQKVVYSADWKDGWASTPHTGISHAFKVLKIESYEDTLNNLQLQANNEQTSLLAGLSAAAQDDYLLHYMLDIESRGSLLSVAHFDHPFDYRLNIATDSAGASTQRRIDLVETFNYLLGLRVQHIDAQLERGYLTVTGQLPSGEKTLVLWRDVDKIGYEALKRLCDKLAINPADSEYAVVYINGDHNIPSSITSTESEGNITKELKIRQIEAEFLAQMFAVDGG